MDNVEIFLNRLQHPVMAGIDLSLDRMHRLLGRLGSPQKRLPPVIHVAGTNGKGSLIAYLQAIFEAAGYRLHRFTSPHLVHFRERIVLAGKEIDYGYLEKIIKHVATLLPEYPATFFEATTAAAFLAFSERPADILLLETGMGGRLDATNVLEKPLLTAITPVSLDHCEYLGPTLPAIAGEKAGIIKRGVPCIVGKQVAEVQSVIAQKAAALQAPLVRYGAEWQIEWQGETGWYQSPTRKLQLTPALAGKHQYDNAGSAIACIDQLKQFAITDAHITHGITHALWPARLQPLKNTRYNALLGDGINLWLDGGHNPQGGEVLADWLAEQRNTEIYLICGMLKGKDVAGYLRLLAPYAKALVAIAIPQDPQSQPPEQLAAAARQIGMDATASASLENALQMIRARARTPAITCICGSLYLAGKVLAAL